MNRSLELYYDEWAGWFTLLLQDRPRQSTAAGADEEYAYLFHPIVSLKTKEIVGFSNEGGDLAQDYPRLMKLLAAHPVPGCYDVPDLGLTGATLLEIVTAIYEHYVVGQQPAFVYPVGVRVPALQVAEDEPKEYASEVDH
ncbi:MAG: hypothetical protein ISS49_13070 [Anaerolineae bacterium]|nr:hypothetical protein [Anaerolineae bacterium]